MIKNYHDFLAVINVKCSQYEQIPEEHLSYTGRNVHDLYKAVRFNACFSSNATELLELLHDDDDVAIIKCSTESEFRTILRCLERLAAEERIPTT